MFGKGEAGRRRLERDVKPRTSKVRVESAAAAAAATKMNHFNAARLRRVAEQAADESGMEPMDVDAALMGGKPKHHGRCRDAEAESGCEQKNCCRASLQKLCAQTSNQP